VCSSAATTAAAPARLVCSRDVVAHLNHGAPVVAPSNALHSPNERLNVSGTSFKEHKSSKAVAGSVCMSGPVLVGNTYLPWLFG
jgi:hypothetical protein